MNEFHYSKILKDKFEERMNANPYYSLRAFARDLGLSPSNLSEVLNRKKALSERSALKVSQRLNFSESERERFCNIVIAQDGRSKIKKTVAMLKIAQSENQQPSLRMIQEDTFKVISDWYHFAIMELLTIKSFKSDPEWIAKQLDVPVAQVNLAIERLLRMELIERKNGKLRSTGVQLKAGTGIPSESIRKFNRQMLEKAIAAIELQNVDERYLTTLTSAISKGDYLELVSMMEAFKRKFHNVINSKNKESDPDHVYCLSMQFIKLNSGDSK